MSKGFAKPPKKYPPKGRWFCSYNWENGFWGTLDECLDRVQHCFNSDEFFAADMLLLSLREEADPNNPAHQTLIQAVESKIQQERDLSTAKARSSVRDRCLRQGSAEGGACSGYWEISFEGKGGES